MTRVARRPRADGRRPLADGVLAWLLEEEQPSIRAEALVELADEDPESEQVRAARGAIGRRGWASTILAEREPWGGWSDAASTYRPKYLATNWRLIVLADLGMTRRDPAIRAACELWIDRQAKDDGGFGPDGVRRSHLCTTGNTTRALIELGYADHPAVRSALDWLVGAASRLGGWSCWGSGRNLDSWEPLSAFAALPRSQWTPEMTSAVGKAAEFFLERELMRQGERYAPWFRFHDPVHYYYDILVGLDLLTRLGYGADPRLGPALELLRERRRRDGRWVLDALHPDVDGAMADWYARHPKDRPVPLALEVAGEPSKRITLRAVTVLRRVEIAQRSKAPPP